MDDRPLITLDRLSMPPTNQVACSATYVRHANSACAHAGSKVSTSRLATGSVSGDRSIKLRHEQREHGDAAH